MNSRSVCPLLITILLIQAPVIFAAQPPDAPVLLAPENDTWAASNTPEFSWMFTDPDTGDQQTACQVQLDKSTDFASVDHDSGKINSSSTKYVPVAPLPDGIYYWRVRVWDTEANNSTWSAVRKIKIDATAPLNPVGLWSPSHTIGEWSNSNVIEMNWSLPEGGELGSGYASLWVTWDTSSSTVSEQYPWIHPDARSAASPPMRDGNSVHFHIRAKDRAGNWAEGAAHLGPFWIDTAPPEFQGHAFSPSHEPGVWTNDTTVDVYWSNAFDALSGIAGYSFSWDDQWDTTPPMTLGVGADVQNASSAPLADGDRWIFHLRAADNAGNWLPRTISCGPFHIDTSPPEITGISLDGGANYTSCRNATAIIQAEDAPEGSGLAAIRWRFNYGDWNDWEPYHGNFTFNMTGEDRLWTVGVQAMDWACQTSLEASATLLLDTRAPAVTGVRINGGANLTKSTRVMLSISIEDPAPSSGVDLMSLGTDGKTWGPWEPFCKTRTFDLAAGDGSKTVFVRSRDRTGNIGPAANATIVLDTAPPATSLPRLPATVDDPGFTVSWSGVDGTSGVASFDVQYCDGTGPWTDWLLATRATSAAFSGEDGHNYSFRARARDRAGNLEQYPLTARTSTLVEIPRPVVSINRPETGSELSGVVMFTGTSFHPKANLSVTGVQVRIDNGSWLDAEGISNWTSSMDTARLGNGKHLLTVRAFDGTKYSSEETMGFTVKNLKSVTNVKPSSPSPGSSSFWTLVVALAAAVTAGALLVALRMRRPPAGGRRPS